MVLLIIFAFIAGVVTVLSPCILPLLPIILSSSFAGKEIGKARPFGVVTGFVMSFTFFTLFLSTIVRLTSIPADSLRIVAVVVIAVLGISLLIPKLQLYIEVLFSRLSSKLPQSNGNPSFWGGLVVGLSLGLLWTPCVGPILASVISLAITGTVTLDTFLLTFAYAVGTALPMFVIIYSGQNVLQKVPWLLRNTPNIQKAFGVLMILTAIGIFTNVDRKFQTFIITQFPQYGTGLTKIEDTTAVQNQLNNLINPDVQKPEIGKPMLNVLENKGPMAPELILGGQWFNSEPFILEQQRGKVVLVDFWTYSCINCQRTIPYLKSWWEKYKDKGLVIVGVHSPEFEFEKDPKNVMEAITDFGISYPVMQDNAFATWQAYNNRYWPAKYILDKDGFIRYTHFGEGKYDETEKVIQELLREAGMSDVSSEVNNLTYTIQSRTPETYLGYSRIENYASIENITPDAVATYTSPDLLRRNEVAFDGKWTITKEYAAPTKGSQLLLRFEAKEVFLVMRPKQGTTQVRVSIDAPIANLGEDVKDGVVTVTEDTLYKLVKLTKAEEHTIKLQFLDDNIELYAFTFG